MEEENEEEVDEDDNNETATTMLSFAAMQRSCTHGPRQLFSFFF